MSNNFALGLVAGLIISGTAAKAVEITLSQLTVLDFYKCAAMSGLLSNTGFSVSPEVVAIKSTDYAQALYSRRNR
jgi:hypothetical protein